MTTWKLYYRRTADIVRTSVAISNAAVVAAALLLYARSGLSVEGTDAWPLMPALPTCISILLLSASLLGGGDRHRLGRIALVSSAYNGALVALLSMPLFFGISVLPAAASPALLGPSLFLAASLSLLIATRFEPGPDWSPSLPIAAAGLVLVPVASAVLMWHLEGKAIPVFAAPYAGMAFGTALSLLLGGAGLLALAWSLSPAPRIEIGFYGPHCLAILILVAGAVGYEQVCMETLLRVGDMSRERAEIFSVKVQSGWRDLLNEVADVSDVADATDPLSPEARARAREVAHGEPLLHALVYIDSTRIVRWVVPQGMHREYVGKPFSNFARIDTSAMRPAVVLKSALIDAVQTEGSDTSTILFTRVVKDGKPAGVLAAVIVRREFFAAEIQRMNEESGDRFEYGVGYIPPEPWLKTSSGRRSTAPYYTSFNLGGARLYVWATPRRGALTPASNRAALAVFLTLAMAALAVFWLARAHNRASRITRRFRTLADSSHDLIIETDLEGRIVSASQSLRQRLNLREDEVVGRLLTELLAEPSRRSMEAVIREAPLGVQPDAAHHVRFCCADGSLRDAELTVRSILSDADRVPHLLINAWDITEWVNSRERAARMYDHLPLPAFIVNRDTLEILVANAEAQQLAGVDLPGRLLTDITAGENAADVYEFIRAGGNAPGTVRVEMSAARGMISVELVRQHVHLTPGEVHVAIRLSDELFKSDALRDALLPVLFIGQGADILWANSAARKEFDCHYFGTNFRIPAGLAEFNEAVRAVLGSDGRTGIRRIEFESVAGRWYSAVLQKNRWTNQAAVMVWFYDLTSHREAERVMAYAQSIIRATPAPVAAIDLTGTVRHWNQAASRATGIVPEPAETGTFLNPATGRRLTVFDVVGEQAAPRMREIIERIRAGETISDVPSMRKNNADGRLYRNTYAPLREADGLVSGVVLISHDVTDLTMQQERLDTFDQFLLDGVFVFDVNPSLHVDTPVETQVEHLIKYGRFTQCNRAFAQYYGLAVDDIVDRPLQEIFNAIPVASSFPDVIAALVRNNYSVNLTLPQPDGRGGEWLANFSISCVVQGDQVFRAHGIVRDVTTTSDIEALLRIMKTPQAIMIAEGPELNCVFANDVAVQTLGAASGPRLCGLLNDDDVQRVKLYTRLDLTLWRHDATSGRFQATVRRLRDERYLIFLQDMAEAEALASSEFYARVARSGSAIAHNLNNPLQTILALGEQIASDPRVPGHLGHKVESLLHAAGRACDAARLLNDQYASFGAGESAVDLPAIDVAALLRELTEEQAEYVAGSVQLDWRGLSRRPLYCRASRAQIMGIAETLLTNARDAHHRRTSDTGAKSIWVRARLSNGSIIVEVEDNAGGVDQSLHLFAFGATTKSQNDARHGIGLHTSQRNARLMGGNLEYFATQNGSLFRLTLPASEAQPAPVPGVARISESRERSLRVLIVDDEVPFLESIAECFVTRGHVVATATSGEDALSVIQSRKTVGETFDVILSDLHMEGTMYDGRALLDIVEAAHPELARHWVVLTGDPQACNSFSRGSGVHVLPKPFHVRDLFAVVERAAAPAA